jgi:hypothetical protein
MKRSEPTEPGSRIRDRSAAAIAAPGLKDTDGRGARSALERSARRAFSDQEWIQMRGTLLQFYAVLSNWKKLAEKGSKKGS